MGIIIALVVFGFTSFGAIHAEHMHKENTGLKQQVQVLQSQNDGANLHIDGVPVRNLSDE